MKRNPQLTQTETILRLIMEGTATITGEAFFYELTRHLALALGVRYAFISEFTQVNTRVRTLAFWAGGDFLDNVEYALKGTPCEAVLCGEISFYPKNVQAVFPDDQALIKLAADSYLAVPLTDRHGIVLGHLAAINDKPMVSEPIDLSIFKIFGARAVAELERIRAEAANRKTEKRLTNILESTLDAIISIDQEQQITLFNRAAEQVFQCNADQALGRPFERFLSPGSCSLFAKYLGGIGQSVDSNQQMWVPEGLTAQRSDGNKFPIEATISLLEVAGEKNITIILRDVNERKRAEEALRELRAENVSLQEAISQPLEFEEMVGGTAKMQDLYQEIEAVASTESTVLISGETGTGKELIARALHKTSGRRNKIFIKINCAALPSELIESELFGHEKGAFTGATQQRKGRFELADGGSIFLDEVGELSPQAQAKLLRVLQEQEFERVGGAKTIKVDVRVIAATNRELMEMASAGMFRSDLYYRLNVFPLQVPPLRERNADIPQLAKYFLAKLSRKLGRTLDDFSPDTMARLQHYHWPGNVRELQNIIERAAILSKGRIVELHEGIIFQPDAAAPSTALGSLQEVERNHILQVLEACDWVVEGKQGAAIMLGLKPSTLRFRMQKLDISKSDRSS